MSLIVKAGKAGKKVLKKFLPEPVHHISYTRRVERVCTKERVVAMTFDDGPMDLPASPDRFGGRCLTDVLLDTLSRHHAFGTFDIIGDTSANYPDEAGRNGEADWGGVKYDHYPDFGKDNLGGAEHNDRLIRRILDEGHQITNHGYRHVIFGKKPFVYGKRAYLGGVDEAVADLTKLHELMRDRYGYEMTMARPPHYVDKMDAGFTSYDVYDQMGYTYMAASFDGAGWLPIHRGTPEESLNAEVDAMVEPLEKLLRDNPDALCGQIIFQKDGYNMARRTPVAFGLEKQLQLLEQYGYRVVTVEQLMTFSPFADVGKDDPDFEKLAALQKEHAIVFSDNRLRLDTPMAWGELSMLLAPRKEAIARRTEKIRTTGRTQHAYLGAMEWCTEQKLIPAGAAPDAPCGRLPEHLFAPVSDFSRREIYRAYKA